MAPCWKFDFAQRADSENADDTSKPYILYTGTVVSLPLTTPVKRTGIRYSVALPHMIFNWHEQ